MRGGEVLPVTRESNASVQATQLFSSPPRLPEPTLVEEAVRERLFGLSAVEVLSMDKSKEALREKSKLVGAELERRVLRLLIEEGYRVVQNNVIVKDVNGRYSIFPHSVTFGGAFFDCRSLFLSLVQLHVHTLVHAFSHIIP